MPILTLHGCPPEPLGNYLKAVGIFRLVAEQADPSTRAWWEGGVLKLLTRLSEPEILEFFLGNSSSKSAYSPSPIFAPWGGRPGFYCTGSNVAAKARLDRLEGATEKRPQLSAAAQSLSGLRGLLTGHDAWDQKTKALVRPWLSAEKGKKDKAALMAVCRNTLPMRFVEWMDACLALEDEGDATFGILFGTGGNEGSADITNNFWYFVEQCIGFPTAHAESKKWLSSAVFSSPRFAGLMETAGQLFPGSAAGENIGQGFTGAAATNPWDVIFAMEGAMLFASAVTKRLSQNGHGKAAFPFILDHVATGQPQETGRDESKQDARKSKCKSEILIPLWDKPFTLPELRSLLTEGRLQMPDGNSATYSVQGLEAIAGLGVSAGVRSFRRVGFFERRGNVNIAATLEDIPVPTRPARVLKLLDELKPFRRAAFRGLREGPQVPDRLLDAKQRIEMSIARAVRLGCQEIAVPPPELQKILYAVFRLQRECAFTQFAREVVNPCPPLSQRWIDTNQPINCLDGSSECHLGLALASLLPWGEHTRKPRQPAVGSLMTNLVPLARDRDRWVWDERPHSAVWSEGAPLHINLATVLRRRLVDSQSGKGDGLPLASFYGASFADMLALWNGQVDETRLAQLMCSLALVDFGNAPKQNCLLACQVKINRTPSLAQLGVWLDGDDHPRISIRSSALIFEQESAFALPRAYALLKLCFLGGRLPAAPLQYSCADRSGNEPFPNSPLRLLNLLLAGRGGEALVIAAQMLRAKGYAPIVRDEVLLSGEWRLTLAESQRIAGMLLVPVCYPGFLAALSIKPKPN
jgi:CRISPR-associated protein Csx17